MFFLFKKKESMINDNEKNDQNSLLISLQFAMNVWICLTNIHDSLFFNKDSEIKITKPEMNSFCNNIVL